MTTMPREMLLLVGGFGTRLRSVVSDVPKPMAPIAGRPFLEYLLDYWIEQGVRRFVLSVGYMGDSIKEHFGTNYKHAEVSFVHESGPLGTGGAVRMAFQEAPWSGDYILMANGDTWFEVDLNALARDACQQGKPVTMALKSVESNDRYGGVTIDDAGLVTAFGAKNQTNSLINGGCYLLDVQAVSRLLRPYPERFSFEDDLLTSLSAERQVASSTQNQVFLDIGIPDDYRRATEIVGRYHSKSGERVTPANHTLKGNIEDSIRAKEQLAADQALLECFDNAVQHVISCYRAGGRLYIAGNGGSAADAQHLAAEFVSKLAKDRNPLPAEALTVDSSILTAIGNDYGFENIFARQLAGKLKPNDVFLGITTSGRSPNILKALDQCRTLGVKSIVFTGRDGGQSRGMADYCIVVPGLKTSTIQELHIVLAHSLCECVESALFS